MPLISTHIGLDAKYISPKEAGLLVTNRPERVQSIAEGDERLEKLRISLALSFSLAFLAIQKTEHSVHLIAVVLILQVLSWQLQSEAELYENFTDVDSVFAANPTIVDNPIAIEKMTYREMRELAYAGFSVFHDEALMPAFRVQFPFVLKIRIIRKLREL